MAGEANAALDFTSKTVGVAREHHPSREVNKAADRVLNIQQAAQEKLNDAESLGREVPGLKALKKTVSHGEKSNRHGEIADETRNPLRKVFHAALSSYHAHRAQHAYNIADSYEKRQKWKDASKRQKKSLEHASGEDRLGSHENTLSLKPGESSKGTIHK